MTENKQTTRQLGLEELQVWCKAKIEHTTMAENRTYHYGRDYQEEIVR